MSLNMGAVLALDVVSGSVLCLGRSFGDWLLGHAAIMDWRNMYDIVMKSL